MRVRNVHGEAVVDEDDDEDLEEFGHVAAEHAPDHDEEDSQILRGHRQVGEKVLHLHDEPDGEEGPRGEVVHRRGIVGQQRRLEEAAAAAALALDRAARRIDVCDRSRRGRQRRGRRREDEA